MYFVQQTQCNWQSIYTDVYFVYTNACGDFLLLLLLLLLLLPTHYTCYEELQLFCSPLCPEQIDIRPHLSGMYIHDYDFWTVILSESLQGLFQMEKYLWYR
jgi:hypothetical protein